MQRNLQLSIAFPLSFSSFLPEEVSMQSQNIVASEFPSTTSKPLRVVCLGNLPLNGCLWKNKDIVNLVVCQSLSVDFCQQRFGSNSKSQILGLRRFHCLPGQTTCAPVLVQSSAPGIPSLAQIELACISRTRTIKPRISGFHFRFDPSTMS